MEIVRLPQKGTRWRGTTGEMELWTAGSVLIGRFARYGHDQFYPPLAEHVEKLLVTQKTIALFFDAAGLDRYDSALRTRLTAYLREHLKRIRRIDVFTHSRIVSMGVSVASLALGGIIQSHTDAASFRKAVNQELEAHEIRDLSASVLDG